MSTRKRSYPYSANGPTGILKQRMVGGRVLTYRPSAPVAGSYRSRQMVAAMRRPIELKGVDFPLTQAAVLATTNTNAGIVVANLIDPGSGSFNRIGRKVTLTSLRLKVRLSFTSALTAGFLRGASCRMVVVWDKQPQGVLPTFDTIFGRTVQNGTESTQYNDPLKYDNTSRFRVLRDCVITQNPTAVLAATTFEYDHQVDEYIDLKKLESVYSGQTIPQTIADISSGALYVIFRAEANNAGVEQWAVTAESFGRLRYMD